MLCPKCGCLDDKVIETRISKNGSHIRRRRECAVCTFRFTTREELVSAGELLIVKRDGLREEFNAEKLRLGVRHACWKRPVSEAQIESIVARITTKVLELQKRELPSRIIGEFVMEILRNTDEVAFVRFASVYRRFKDVDDFIDEVHNLSSRPTHKR